MLEPVDMRAVNWGVRLRSCRQCARDLMRALLGALLSGGLLLGLSMGAAVAAPTSSANAVEKSQPAALPMRAEEGAGLAVATFAGGCFWCMEPPFDKLDGVVSTVSGYTGGLTPDPDYKSVSRGITGHAEAVQVTYDPSKVDYAMLLDVFWHNIDPLARDRQFCDIGSQYRTAIFYHDAEQARLARASRVEVARALAPLGEVVTEIVEAGRFFPAEAYHQDYYLKNPIKYRHYRHGCGRDRRLNEVWRGR